MAKKKPLLKKLAKVMQLYARLRDTDDDGYGHCCSCGEVFEWSKLQGGHYQPKGVSYNAAAFDPRNINVQCSSCNLYLQGNPAGYQNFMEIRYGHEVFEDLFLMSKRTRDREELEGLLVEYRDKNKELAATKSFKVTLY